MCRLGSHSSRWPSDNIDRDNSSHTEHTLVTYIWLRKHLKVRLEVVTGSDVFQNSVDLAGVGSRLLHYFMTAYYVPLHVFMSRWCPPVWGTGCKGSLVSWKACPHNALSVHWERSTAGCILRRRPGWPPSGPCPGTWARRRTHWSASRCPRCGSRRRSCCPRPGARSSSIYRPAPCCTGHWTLVLLLPEI